MTAEVSLEQSEDAYHRIEDEFQQALDISLNPRGWEMLYDLVNDLHLPPGAAVLDVGCGAGRQALTLAERFAFNVRGVDPVKGRIEKANERRQTAIERLPALADRLHFEIAAAEALPVDDASVDLVWCKDVLVLVGDIESAYAEFRRVLKDDGRVVLFQSCFATPHLGAPDLDWLWREGEVMRANSDPERTEAAIAAAGLRVDERLEVGIEWREWSEEHTGNEGRQLLHAARLLRAPERYIAQFGQWAYDIMLGDCLWHVYHMLGKLSARVYLLSKAPSAEGAP
jgi:SAM-dependent methyltransferase